MTASPSPGRFASAPYILAVLAAFVFVGAIMFGAFAPPRPVDTAVPVGTLK